MAATGPVQNRPLPVAGGDGASRGRGRGAGRGVVATTPTRGAPRGRGAGLGSSGPPPQGQGRHSSVYVPSADNPPRGGALRPQSNYSPSGNADSSHSTNRSLPDPNSNPRGANKNFSTLRNSGNRVPAAKTNSTPTAVRRGMSDGPTLPPRSPPLTCTPNSLPKLPSRGGPTPMQTSGGSSIGGAGGSSGSSGSTLDVRNQCLQEIYQTEKDYITDLETLIDVFIFPMRTVGGIDEQKLYNIFSNVEVLIHCNREVLKELEAAMNGTDAKVTIGSVFTQLAEYFKMYKVYCANQQNSLTTLETLLKKNQQFKRNLEVCHSDPRCKGLFLQSFLIKPIQRVCKYPLLLREMIRHTPEDHSDYQQLENAFAKINSVLTDINEAQRQAEGLQRILDLQDLIEGIDTLVAPGRKFVKEGELTFYKSPKSKTGEKRTVFFFTDLILLTSRKGERRFEHKMSVPVDSCKLVVIADTSHIKNAFELAQSQLQKKCILSGADAQESNQWIKEIRALIKGYQKKQIQLMGK